MHGVRLAMSVKQLTKPKIIIFFLRLGQAEYGRLLERLNSMGKDVERDYDWYASLNQRRAVN